MRSFLSYCLIIAFCTACGAAKNSDREGNAGTGSGKPPITEQRNDPLDSSINVDFQKSAFSQVYRNSQTYRYTYAEMSKAVKENKVPFLIPNIEVHNTIIDRSSMPSMILAKITECGNSIAINPKTQKYDSITDRISDCKNTPDMEINSVFWNGKNKGRNGEGNWELVSYSKGFKVWKDTRTGLVWSDIVKITDFETASGVTFEKDENLDNRICQVFKNTTPPHELGRISDTKIHWRLPNRNEYLQADLNGARYVLSNTEDETWTSSYAGSKEAWAIVQKTGELKKVRIDENRAVRCIGVPL